MYPSLYEGFGLPVLEAMQCGTPVIVSRDPAILEAAGDAAIAVEATGAGALAEAMAALAQSCEKRGALREQSLKRAAGFTWRLTAQRTREVYDRAAHIFHHP